ncbi:MAG: urea transporter [Marinifilaceae bacterium]
MKKGNSTSASANTVRLPSVFSFGFIQILLRGAGQVMFQGNAWTGIFFLAGIFVGSYTCGVPQVAWGAVVALVCSTLSGYLLGYPPEKGNDGLWGFCGILVGCAIPTFIADTWTMWLTLVFMSFFSTWVMVGLNNLLAPYKVSSLTFPFVILGWFTLLAARVLHGLPDAGMATPALPGDFSTTFDASFGSLVIYWLKGISQVFLINSWIAGLLFIIGLAINNIWSALWAMIGSLLGLACAILFQANGWDVANGMYGYCPVLTAIALGCTFYQVNWRVFIWTCVGTVATFFIQAAMYAFFEPWGIATLTGPFCIATWLFLWPHLKLDNHKILQNG